MKAKAEKLLRKVILKSMGNCDSVDSFFRSVERIRQIGDSSDIALTVMALDSIEENIPVMQDYLNDDDPDTEIYEDMPVGNVLQAIMNVLQMDHLLMAGQMPQLHETRERLKETIAILHATTK